MDILKLLDEIEKAYSPLMFRETTKKERDAVAKLFPSFIDKTSAMVGRHLVQIIREKLIKEIEWRERYKARLIKRGYILLDAHYSANAAEYADDINPKDAADDEISYAMTD